MRECAVVHGLNMVVRTMPKDERTVRGLRFRQTMVPIAWCESRDVCVTRQRRTLSRCHAPFGFSHARDRCWNPLWYSNFIPELAISRALPAGSQ